MIQTVRGGLLRRLIISAAASIEINKQQLNDLNVFPVPDGDTGTNMSMTINAAAGDLRKVEDPSLEKAAATAASAMLRGARGNSGVILSLLFRGMSKKLKGHTECDGVLWGLALHRRRITTLSLSMLPPLKRQRWLLKIPSTRTRC